MKFGTKAVHAGVAPDPLTGAVMTPIYQTSTYAQESPSKHKGYGYARGANPTRDALQKSIAALENGQFGLCFSSGMGATDAVIKLLKPGDEVITSNDLYGGSYRMFKRVFEKYGITFHFIDLSNPDNLAACINGNTKLLWLETPSNPLMRIIDIGACTKMAREHNILVAVDNTFASPYLQNPLSLGGVLKKGKTYTFEQNFRFDNQLYGGDALWYVIAEDPNGKRYKGMAIIETESEVNH